MGFQAFSKRYQSFEMNFKVSHSLNVVRLFSSNAIKSQKKNHYDSLGITPKATQSDVKDAYYKLSKKYHPDKNVGNSTADKMFRDIAEAYETLGNIKSRKLYDRGITLRDQSSYEQQTEDPELETYQHASFYHHRNKPTSTKSSVTGKSNVYNMDEWTRAHYSQTFSDSYSKKKSGNEHLAFDKMAKEQNYKNAMVVGLFVSAIFFIIALEINATPTSSRFDHSGLLEEKKPD